MPVYLVIARLEQRRTEGSEGTDTDPLLRMGGTIQELENREEMKVKRFYGRDGDGTDNGSVGPKTTIATSYLLMKKK